MINKTILNLKKLKSFHIHNGNYDPDIDRAIKAIEQQSNMVSRIAYEQVMWERDVAINQLKELGYGFGEKIKTDKDAISRQATIEAFQMFRGYEANRTNAEWVDRIETVVKKLPSVNPTKTGHWIDEFGGCECSECGCLEGGYSDYCPNCGAKMQEIEE